MNDCNTESFPFLKKIKIYLLTHDDLHIYSNIVLKHKRLHFNHKSVDKRKRCLIKDFLFDCRIRSLVQKTLADLAMKSMGNLLSVPIIHQTCFKICAAMLIPFVVSLCYFCNLLKLCNQIVKLYFQLG